MSEAKFNHETKIFRGLKTIAEAEIAHMTEVSGIKRDCRTHITRNENHLKETIMIIQYV